MNGLAFEHYVDRPWLIFQSWNATRIHETLAEAVASANKANRRLDPTTIARLRWYPTLTSDFIVAGQIGRPDMEAILSTPTARFMALANHYEELAPVLESKLLEDPESVERIIRWVRYKDKALFRSEEEYMKCLGDDPNRHYRLTPANRRIERAELSGEAKLKKGTNAAWAYLYVSCTSIGALDKELSDALASSEEYSYLTALVLRKRGLAAEVWQHLLHSITSHRWAYHVMRDLEPGTNIEQPIRTRLMRVIHTSPPWAVQLWQDRGFRGETLNWAFKECATAASDHECMPELHSWHRLAKHISGTRVAVTV